MRRTRRFVLAFYEVDRLWGGPEEGGWWYDAGEFVRVFTVVISEARAYELARRANRLLDYLQRELRDVGSVLYGGGRYRCMVHEDCAPASFPAMRPYYE